jgi:hypothetical protein
MVARRFLLMTVATVAFAGGAEADPLGLVSDQSLIGSGVASVRKKLPRL